MIWIWLKECWGGGGGNGYVLTPLPSAGVVPSELPPFSGPYFVTWVGSGSKARLQRTPPGIWGSVERNVSLLMERILASRVAETL